MTISTLILYDLNQVSGLGHQNRSRRLVQSLTKLNKKKFKYKEMQICDRNSLPSLADYYGLHLIVDSFFLSDEYIINNCRYFDSVLVIDDWLGRKIHANNLLKLDWTPCAHLSPLSHNPSNSYLGIEYAPIFVSQNKEISSGVVVYLGNSFVYTEIFIMGLIERLSELDSDIYIIGGTLKCDLDCLHENRVVHYSNLQNTVLLTLLSSSSYLVCAGGWIAFEAVSCGCFLLLVMLESSTYYDAAGFSFMGLGLPFCTYSSPTSFYFIDFNYTKLDLKLYEASRSRLGSQLNKLSYDFFQ